MRRLIREIPSWSEESSRGGLKKRLLHLVVYTSSLTPMVPRELAFFPVPEQFRSHQGMRNRFASILEDIAVGYSIPEAREAAESFGRSGPLYQELTDRICRYLKAAVKAGKVRRTIENTGPLLEDLLREETAGFSRLASIREES